MWKIRPDFDNTGNLAMSIIHLDSMVRSAHLMGIADATQIPHHLTFDHSLDAFQAFYVNKYLAGVGQCYAWHEQVPYFSNNVNCNKLSLFLNS